MRSVRKAASVFRRTWSLYRRHGGALIVLAALVFVPLGLVDALSTRLTANSLSDDAVEIVAVGATALALGATSLLGDIFYSGAVAIWLAGAPDERTAAPLQLARRIAFARLLLVDLLYVAIVIAALALFVIPGLLAFVWLTLAGPVVEIEHRGVLAALRRSFELVRGSFVAVALVVFPVEVGGDMVSEAVGHAVHAELGESLLAVWAAEAAVNVLVTPIFAVAVVLLTLDLIAAKEGIPARLNRSPVAAEIAGRA